MASSKNLLIQERKFQRPFQELRFLDQCKEVFLLTIPALQFLGIRIKSKEMILTLP